MLDEQVERNKELLLESDSHKERFMKLERELHIATEGGKDAEKTLREKLDKALEELERASKDREAVRKELAAISVKYKEAVFTQQDLQAGKAKVDEQIENLIASKQLLHKTMTGQLMSMKMQLDEANEGRQRLAEDLRRATQTQTELQDKYRTEQLKTKTLLEEVKRAKYKK